MPHTQQREFINGQLFAMTLAATAQRSNLYTEKLTDAQRKPFQDSLRADLEKISREYEITVSDDQHVKNIQDLSDKLSMKHAALLQSGKMKFGHAQKALNLYLKYLWCLGDNLTPPHCPIDSIVLRRIPKHTEVRWTKLDSPVQYSAIIMVAKAEANKLGLSIPEWELQIYNSRAA